MGKRSLFKAIKNWIRGKEEEMADALSDPVRDGKFAIADSEKQIANFLAKIARLVADTKRLARERDSAQEDLDKWHGIAEKAVASEKMDDARDALEQKKSAEKRFAVLGAQVEQNDTLITTLREQLAKSRARIARAKSNLTSLNARLEGAKIRRELAKAAADFGTGDGPLAALDDLEKAVTDTETEAEAWEELSGDATADLEEKYGSGGDADVEEELAALVAARAKAS